MQRIKIKWPKYIQNWFSVFMTGQETFNSLTRRHVFRDRLTPRHQTHSKCDSKYKSQLTFQIPKSTQFSDIKRTVKITRKQTRRNVKIMQSNPPKVYELSWCNNDWSTSLRLSPYILFCTSDFTDINGRIVSGCDFTNRYSSLFVTLTHSQKSNLFK